MVLTVDIAVTQNAAQPFATNFHTRKSYLSDTVGDVWSFLFFKVVLPTEVSNTKLAVIVVYVQLDLAFVVTLAPTLLLVTCCFVICFLSLAAAVGGSVRRVTLLFPATTLLVCCV